VQPLGAVQRSGVQLLDHLVRHGRAAAVSPRPGGFPHRGGDWNAAVRHTHAAWEEIVTGRKGA
jgi:hypothetical protein